MGNLKRAQMSMSKNSEKFKFLDQKPLIFCIKPIKTGKKSRHDFCIYDLLASLNDRGGQMLLKNLSNPQLGPIELGEFVCFGSGEGNHVVVKDEGVVEKHARIELKSSGHFLRDLKSKAGTFLNGNQVQESYISIGDILRIGNTEFTFQTQDQFDFLKKMESKNEIWNKQLQKIPSIAASDLSVLILGESGVGKEVLSQAIHRLSLRAMGPVLTVNCSALSPSLAESELFGHIKGSFTGATQDRKGAFETAKGGTLILDEIGDLPLSLQPKLLRALDNKEIKPVGADRIVKTDVRIIACTHQDLKKKVEREEFRLDLFYRLNIIQFCIPALRERMEDFEKLLVTFSKSDRVKFSLAAIQELKNYDWPGNIRELKNVVARAKAFIGNESIEKDHVPQLLESKSYELSSFGMIQVPTQSEGKINIIKEIEKQIIQRRLLVNEGNQRKTADDLGIPRSTLNDRIRAYKIDVDEVLEAKSREIWSGGSH